VLAPRARSAFARARYASAPGSGRRSESDNRDPDKRVANEDGRPRTCLRRAPAGRTRPSAPARGASCRRAFSAPCQARGRSAIRRRRSAPSEAHPTDASNIDILQDSPGRTALLAAARANEMMSAGRWPGLPTIRRACQSAALQRAARRSFVWMLAMGLGAIAVARTMGGRCSRSGSWRRSGRR
jgi:hypothetical protein